MNFSIQRRFSILIKRIMVFFDVISIKCLISCACELHAEARYFVWESDTELGTRISVNPIIRQVLLLLQN